MYGAVWNYRKDYIMLSVNRIYNMCLLAVEDISSMAGSEIGLDDVEKVMNSEISNEEKTNFFIQYLLAQREPLLRHSAPVHRRAPCRCTPPRKR